MRPYISEEALKKDGRSPYNFQGVDCVELPEKMPDQKQTIRFPKCRGLVHVGCGLRLKETRDREKGTVAPHLFYEILSHHKAFIAGVLRVAVSRLLFSVTEEVLHQVFDAYDARSQDMLLSASNQDGSLAILWAADRQGNPARLPHAGPQGARAPSHEIPASLAPAAAV